MRTVPACLLPALIALPFLLSPARSAPTTTRLSVAADGHESLAPTVRSVVLSHNGCYAVFASTANNLVPNDTNAYSDVFVRDLETGEVECLSAANGSDVPAGGESGVISDDGRYAAFLSNTVTVGGTAAPGEQSVYSLFLRDRLNHTTIPISRRSDGTLASADPYNFAISADGQLVAFTSMDMNLGIGTWMYDGELYLFATGPRAVRQETSFGTGVTAFFYGLSMSGSGRSIVYALSLLGNNVDSTRRIYVRDRISGTTTDVSVSDSGMPANNTSSLNISGGPAVSDDGRYVAFESYASNLVPGDTNNSPDVFVRDLQANRTTCVSRTPAGAPAGGWNAAISGDGSAVAFSSLSDDLLPGQTGLAAALILAGRESGPVRAISVAPDGTPRPGGNPSVSADGRRVAYLSGAPDIAPGDINGVTDAFVVDLPTLQTRRVSAGPSSLERGGGDSEHPVMSGDGRYVSFTSYAANFEPGMGGGLYRKDRQTGALTYMDAPDGEVSADGRYVAFRKMETFPVPRYVIYREDLQTGEQVLASIGLDGQTVGVDPLSRFAISADGRFVLFGEYPSAYGAQVLLRRDLAEGTTRGVNVDATGNKIHLLNHPIHAPAVSADGRFVAFTGTTTVTTSNGWYTTNAIFLKDMDTGEMRQVAIAGTTLEGDLALSADGRYLAFSMNPSGSLSTFTAINIFVYERDSGTTERVSVQPDGTPIPNWCGAPTISANGRVVAFVTPANVVAADTNNKADVYVFDRATRQIVLASARPDGTAGNNWSGLEVVATPNTLSISNGNRPSLSADGQWVAFTSQASDLVPNDTNGALDVFVRGPLLPPSGVTVKDVADALRVAAGLSAYTTLKASAIDPGPDNRLDITDVVAACRHMDPTLWPY